MQIMSNPKKLQSNALPDVQNLRSKIHAPFPSFRGVHWSCKRASRFIILLLFVHFNRLHSNPIYSTRRFVRVPDQNHVLAVEFSNFMEFDDGICHSLRPGIILTYYRIFTMGSLSFKSRVGRCYNISKLRWKCLSDNLLTMSTAGLCITWLKVSMGWREFLDMKN